MPPEGEYLLTNVGFSRDEKPLLLLQSDDTFIDFRPLGHSLSMSFDMSQRYCTGWRDITNGERHVCPDHHTVEPRYEQCKDCQARTGFNPAFYHATSVSVQQEARNQEPHILYLAYFAPDVIKVGISLAARQNSRLLEQGARDALILDTLPSAHIARQYEAKIAKLPGIVETVQLSKKLGALKQPHDTTGAAAKLHAIRAAIEREMGVTFSANDILYLDDVYFPNLTPDLSQAVNTTGLHTLSGEVIGMVGSIIYSLQTDILLQFALKKHVGYRFHLASSLADLPLPAQQTSLF